MPLRTVHRPPQTCSDPSLRDELRLRCYYDAYQPPNIAGIRSSCVPTRNKPCNASVAETYGALFKQTIEDHRGCVGEVSPHNGVYVDRPTCRDSCDVHEQNVDYCTAAGRECRIAGVGWDPQSSGSQKWRGLTPQEALSSFYFHRGSTGLIDRYGFQQNRSASNTFAAGPAMAPRRAYKAPRVNIHPAAHGSDMHCRTAWPGPSSWQRPTIKGRRSAPRPGP